MTGLAQTLAWLRTVPSHVPHRALPRRVRVCERLVTMPRSFLESAELVGVLRGDHVEVVKHRLGLTGVVTAAQWEAQARAYLEQDREVVMCGRP